MSENKKQHFVPRFYLKNFSYRNDRKSIGIWTMASKVFIQRGNLHNQAYCDYFYGDSIDLEKAFADLESSAARIISHIIKHNILPKRETQEHGRLLLFLLGLAQRTRYASESVNEMADQIFKIAYKENSLINKNINSFKIRTSDAPRLALSKLNTIFLFSLDLHYKLLINRTKQVFITSDNPVIRHNQYFIRDSSKGHVGFANKGLQLLIPINPTACLMFYDYDIYRVGNRKDTIVSVNNPSDVDEINRFQIINADKVVYFNHEVDERYIAKITLETKKFLKPSKVVTREFSVPPREPNTKRSIVITHPTITRKDLELSFVQITRRAKRLYSDDTDDLFRNPTLVEYVMQREDIVRKRYEL